MGSHAHTGPTFILQKINLVDQSCHLRGFKWSRLFSLGPLEFGMSANKGGEAGIMVLTIEPCTMPSPERRFQRSTRVTLEAYGSYDFPVGGARLFFRKK
jgi:hypothetical protein